MYTRIPGTKDILPDQVSVWQHIEETTRNIFSLYNYQEIRPPLIEEEALFNRSLGESTEIVQKQMFLMKSGEDLFALRPEATASVVRAYVENNLDKTSRFLKLYYIGPMFRMERPQKGRLRQFHQLGCEAIGSASPSVDIEVISLAYELLRKLSIDSFTIRLNNLGCAQDKKALVTVLQEKLEGSLNLLCDDCKVRYSRNILRILDCKNESCQNVVAQLQIGNSHLCAHCQGHFSEVRQGLDALKIPYQYAEFLVRGLDYYTGTVFEVIHDSLGGQQNALGAGGRYDTLVSELGGPDVGAIGFAFGIERLILVQHQREEPKAKRLVYLIALGEECRRQALQLLYSLRQNGIAAETDYEGKSLKGAMRKADDLAARYVLILGDNELKNNTVMLKDMLSGTQQEVKREELINALNA
jgi:histidyl-tRNA synthetase